MSRGTLNKQTSARGEHLQYSLKQTEGKPIPDSATRKPTGQPVSPAGGNAYTVDQVMLQFQQSMLQMTNSFLQTQQHVMLAYLKSRSISSQPMPSYEIQPIAMPVQPMVAPLAVPQSPTPIAVQVSTSPASALPDEEPQAQESVSIPVDDGASADNVKRQADASPEVPFHDPESLASAFIELVSERTGYPVDMLDPELDLETDLGIDSIKRVEILSNFRRLLSEEMQQHFEGSLEELAGLRTLQAITDWIRQIPQQA